MTPEERFTRIENLLSAMTERQAVHDEQLAENARQIEKNARQIEKNTAGIRDLVTVNRTLVDTVGQLRDAMAEGFSRTDKEIKELHASIAELREAGKETDARLTILIDIVDRIIRRNGKDG